MDSNNQREEKNPATRKNPFGEITVSSSFLLQNSYVILEKELKNFDFADPGLPSNYIGKIQDHGLKKEQDENIFFTTWLRIHKPQDLSEDAQKKVKEVYQNPNSAASLSYFDVAKELDCRMDEKQSWEKTLGDCLVITWCLSKIKSGENSKEVSKIQERANTQWRVVCRDRRKQELAEKGIDQVTETPTRIYARDIKPR